MPVTAVGGPLLSVSSTTFENKRKELHFIRNHVQFCGSRTTREAHHGWVWRSPFGTGRHSATDGTPMLSSDAFFFFYLFSPCYFKVCQQSAAEVDRDYPFSPVTEFPPAKIEMCGEGKAGK